MGKKRKISQEDVVEEKRSRPSQSQKNNNNNNNVGKKVGAINRMVLKNFMCHSHLEVVFDNNINFIAGNNGAGKSAILTALVVGLGGKTTVTNRGTNIKCLVKVGTSSATIEIAINNRGFNAYKPTKYGGEITIIRTINASGGGGYKIKSGGTVISQSSKELQNILSFMNIQVANPVCVLNQDMSRNFLLSNDPKKKFEFYVKSSRLEELAQECVLMKESFQELDDHYKAKMKSFDEMKIEMDHYKQKLEDYDNMAILHTQYQQLTKEVVWAEIISLENDQKRQEQCLDKAKNVVEKYKNMITNRAQLIEETRNKLMEFELKINEIRANITEQTTPINEIDRRIVNFKTSIDELNLEKNRLLKAISRDEENIRRLEENIKNYVENLTQKEQEKISRKREIEHHHEQIRLIQDTLETKQNELYQLKNSLRKTEQEESGLVQEKIDLQRQLDTVKDDIENLKTKSSNTLHLYGRNMPQVIDAIKSNEKLFQKVPKGPLGAYIKIKDKKWAVAVEGFLGMNLLNSFTVDNTNDNRNLVKIFNHYYQSARPPSIITSKFIEKVHPVQPNLVRTPPDCVSLFDIIQVDDPVVMNCLIDQLGIENILLIPSSDRAIELLSEVENVPVNCKQGVTIKGDRFYPDPNYRSYCSQYHHAKLLDVDKADVIKMNIEKCGKVKEKIKSVVNQLQMVGGNKSNQRELIREIQMTEEKLKMERNKLRDNLNKLQLADEPELTSNESLEDELKLLKDNVQDKKSCIEQVDEKVKNIKVVLDECKDKKKNARTNINNLEERLPPLMREITRLTDEQNEFTITKNVEKRRLEDAKRNVDVEERKLKEFNSELSRKLELAGNIGDRVETKRKTKEIEDDIKAIENKLQKLNTNMDFGDINKKYKIVLDKYTSAMETLTSIAQNKTTISELLRTRSSHYSHTKKYFVHYTDYNFKQTLEYGNFKGSVKIDFKEKTLELIVIPQHGTQEKTVTTNLSGGERSFSTVAFLYAIWKVLSCPFFFLDEFDVFMDKLNRTKVIDILIHHARQTADTQYVFLTPQDTSFIQDDDVSLHRLEDPVRQNGSL